MPNTTFQNFINLTGGSISGGELSWTATSDNAIPFGVIDNPDPPTGDGNVDSGDFFFQPGNNFTGFYYEEPGGLTFAIFEDSATAGSFFIPYNKSDFDLGAVIPSADSTMLFQAENFEPTGNPICFLPGTQIATPDGTVAVETLQTDDLVMTRDGSAIPVLWIGRQVLSKWRHGARMQPVRIRAGALGDGLPHSDLTVTADHGMVLDELVINAAALVNGSTIDFVPMDELPDSFTVYHIETEAHDVILANGAPAETFVDYAGRQAFDNHQDYLDLYGAERIIPEMPRPRISARRLVPQTIKARLGIVEEDHGFDQPMRA